VGTVDRAVNDPQTNHCHGCGEPMRARSLILTAREDDTEAVSVWRLCSWDCVTSLAERRAAADA
jgi:hypothetical protein